jgi:dihydrofolate synthase / folylpolyglutamate synthase
MQSLEAAAQYLYSLGNEVKSIKLGLERIQGVLKALGHPERQVPCVHVAGTNGKGSVSAMLERGLREAGFRTGLFTSPHLQSPAERIQVNGDPIGERDFLAALQAVEDVSDPDDHPTYFETITAMAFWHFARAGVERLVLEVGLGGRLDATNVVDPLLSVVTPVDYDHQQYLGNTLIEIAREKAGIIKPGRPVILAPQHPEARPAFHGDIEETGGWQVRDLKLRFDGCSYTASQGERTLHIECPLPGAHQVTNSLTAAIALSKLNIKSGAIARGIAQTKWPGRLEIVGREPLIYLDGAHNPAGAARLREFIETHFQGRRIWLVFGVMRDKDVPAITGQLFPLAEKVILTRAQQDRSLEPERISGNAVITQSVPEAIALLKTAPSHVVAFITGSLFIVGEARPHFVAHLQ